MTYFHWGVHGWIPYVVVGALLGLMSHRRGLPLAMRSCFYPLWGSGICGWRGDVVDVLSIACTLFGVCTSLGLGVRQLNKGLVRLDRGTYAGRDTFGRRYEGAGHSRKVACQGKCTEGQLGGGPRGIRRRSRRGRFPSSARREVSRRSIRISAYPAQA